LNGFKEMLDLNGLAHSRCRGSKDLNVRDIHVGKSFSGPVAQSQEPNRWDQVDTPDLGEAAPRKLKSLVWSERMVDQETHAFVRQQNQPGAAHNPEPSDGDKPCLDPSFIGSHGEGLLHLALGASEAVSHGYSAGERGTGGFESHGRTSYARGAAGRLQFRAG
jgi:hypothetical protein